MSKLEQEKNIGNRIVFKKQHEGLTVEIHQRIESWKTTLLAVWLAGWTFCGGVFIYYYQNSEFEAQRIFLLVSLGFWAFFFFRIFRVLFWRLIGKEIIELKGDVLSLRNKIGRFGRTQYFKLSHISHFGKLKVENKNFFQFMDNSFWIIGGDTLGFKYMSKQYQLGKQLEDRDSASLAMVLDKHIKSNQRSAKNRTAAE